VIAILRPGMRTMLVESRKRRIEWLDRVRTSLALDHVEIAGRRLETVATEKFGAISARAFAPLDRLLELSARFSTNETLWLLPKGRGATQECESLHGWTHTFHVEQSLTDPEAGIIVGQLTGRKGKRA
jgi:16S rRNA (guanine527-N7)-methyltransferase